MVCCRFNHTGTTSRRGPDHAEDKNESACSPCTLFMKIRKVSGWLKLGATVRGSDTSTKLMNFTVSVSIFVSLLWDSCRSYMYLLHQTVKYIEKVPHVRTAVECLLSTRRWKLEVFKWAVRMSRWMIQASWNVLFVSHSYFHTLLS